LPKGNRHDGTILGKLGLNALPAAVILILYLNPIIAMLHHENLKQGDSPLDEIQQN
jgi:hypothetical protein